MTESRKASWRDCGEARALIQEELDAGAAGGSGAQRLREAALRGHLAECDACWEFFEGQMALRRGLQAMGPVPFPDEALAEVWARTVDAAPARGERVGPVVRRPWASLARVAAAVAVVLAAWMWFEGRAEKSASTAVLARAAADTRMVMRITNDALARVERATINEAMLTRVSGALLRIPRRVNASIADRL